MLRPSFQVATLATALTFAAVALAANPQQVIPHHQDEPPGPALSPQEAMAKMSVPEGFRVELVAAEPDLVNPVAMTFDDRGRIWVVESLEYPRLEAGAGRDRVKVLADQDGDGRVDSVNVFADGLNIPSGIAVGHGAVWVANSPDILRLEDTDGDLKADRREVVVSGFGRDDTHELPNSLTWGPDGWLYGLNGVFNKSRVRHQGRDHQFTCAVWRLHPRTGEFEIFAEGTSNPWGIAWDGEGSMFLSACVIDHLWHIVESGYYHRQAGAYPPFTWKTESIVDYRHQKAAYCGIHFFDSDAYPPEYRERLYMGNIHGGAINVDRLQRRGSTYRGEACDDFLVANDAWFMPVAQKTGPDGCLYILDWYDRYHCYQDARRDPEGIERQRGRLYRVCYGDAPRAEPFDLGAESDDQLIARLASPNVFFRQRAQRLLAERANPATRESLEALVLDDVNPTKQRRHALWALIGGGPLEVDFHAELLGHDDPFLRGWAPCAAGNQHDVDSRLVDRIEQMSGDSAPDVQLQVAISADKIAGLDALALLVDVLSNCGTDVLIPQIVWQNLHPLLDERSGAFLAALADRGHSPALEAVLPRAVEKLAVGSDTMLNDLVTLLSQLAAGAAAEPRLASQCLGALDARVRSGELDDDRIAALRRGLQAYLEPHWSGRDDHPLFIESLLLAVAWHDERAMDRARELALASAPGACAADEHRIAAVAALVAAGDAELLPLVERTLDDRQNSIELRRELLNVISGLDHDRVANVVLTRYANLPPDLQPAAIELLSERTTWSKQLLAAVSRGEVPATALTVGQVRQMLAARDDELSELVTRHWGTMRSKRDPNREQVLTQVRSLLKSTPGDPVRGASVFNRVCAECHTIYGRGEKVGPDITVNGRNSFEQLLSNVFDPNLVIGAAYDAYTLLTTDGRVITGLLEEEGPERVVLKTQGGKLEVVPRDEIDVLAESELSLMPEGLEKQLTPQEIADLIEYLALDRPPEDPEARRLPDTGP